jgi:hypothetical protein
MIWRKPGQDVSEAVSSAQFSRGDRVACFEWFGQGPMPAPKWHRKIWRSLSKEENDSIDRLCDRICEKARKREPMPVDDSMYDYSMDDLLYFIGRVET